VKQLITRIDDDLHRALKERAAQEGRSLNELVTEVLAAAVDDQAAAFRRRLAASGLRVLPPDPHVPSPRHELDEGEAPDAADAVLDALLAERDAR
jgi:plasmid stability protein